MRRRRLNRDSFVELELDGYETASTAEDLSDGFAGPDSEDDDIVERGYHNPLLGINITDEYSGISLPDVQVEDSEHPFKNTEMVLKFSHLIKPEALVWFIQKVTAKKSRGGAELLLRREPYTGDKNEGMVVHVTAFCWRHLEVAELLEIKKLDYSNVTPIPREFKIREINQFLRNDMEPHDILTSAEKQMVVLHELNNFHSLPGEKYVPGYKNVTLVPGQSIFHTYTTTGLIRSYFPLHAEEELNRLNNKWFFEFFDDSPYEQIRSYFGDGTCLYFNFVAYYSQWLLFPTVIGLILQFLSWGLSSYGWINAAVVIFCLVNMVFLTLFLIYWQRFQSFITYKWGTLRMNVWEEPRANYWGKPSLDPVTGKLQRRFPFIITRLRTYCCSFPLILVLCGIALWTMLLYLVIEDELKVKYIRQLNATDAEQEPMIEYIWKHFVVINMPGVAYAVCVLVANRCYRWLAHMLTEWENHRTETQFERHLVLKMVIFEVTNNFSLFFYTAFILKDMALLRRRLLVILSIVQIWSIIEQSVLPLIIRKGQQEMSAFLSRQKNKLWRQRSGGIGEPRKPRSYPGLGDDDVEVMDENDPRVAMTKVEENMSPYDKEADFDDYLNLFLQFGYIFFFSSVVPAAACFAFFCNIGLLKASLFKRREVFQRSLAIRVSSIGAWQQAFEFMAVIAVITNCALIGLNLRDSFPSFSDWEWTLLCFCAEHILIAIQHFVKKVVSKIPYRVKVAFAALEYRSKEAFKREQARRTRRKLGRVFRPINEKLQSKNLRREDRRSEQRIRDAESSYQTEVSEDERSTLYPSSYTSTSRNANPSSVRNRK